MNLPLIAWRVVHADFQSSRGFRWPFPGGVAEAPGPMLTENTGPCPDAQGDGLCLAKNWAGAASGGIASATVLVCAYNPRDVLGEDETKVRVMRATVLDVWDSWRLVREYGSGANLSGAYLREAYLSGANLSRANLRRADLRRADLREADTTDAIGLVRP